MNKLLVAFIIVLSAGIWAWVTFTKNPLSPGLDYQPYGDTALRFDLVDPELASAEIKPLVMQGYHILMETQKYLPEYAGDRITCNNCHFACGNTLGGSNGGISLVGVTKVYPRSLPGNKTLSLAERINYCFEKSLNGKPLPLDSQPMQAMLAYLEWISSKIPTANTPWLGLKALKSRHTPDPKNGQKVYLTYCVSCHGSDGQGEPRDENLNYPPLWGSSSFNARAGMHSVPTLASFVYYNMPYTQADLSKKEALDVAAFINEQPRPE